MRLKLIVCHGNLLIDLRLCVNSKYLNNGLIPLLLMTAHCRQNPLSALAHYPEHTVLSELRHFIHQGADIPNVFRIALKQAANWTLSIGVTLKFCSPSNKAKIKLPGGFDHL